MPTLRRFWKDVTSKVTDLVGLKRVITALVVLILTLAYVFGYNDLTISELVKVIVNVVSLINFGLADGLIEVTP